MLLTLGICMLNGWRARKSVDDVNLEGSSQLPSERIKILAVLVIFTAYLNIPIVFSKVWI